MCIINQGGKVICGSLFLTSSPGGRCNMIPCLQVEKECGEIFPRKSAINLCTWEKDMKFDILFTSYECVD